MKMLDVLNEAKAKNATKVFVNPSDLKNFFIPCAHWDMHRIEPLLAGQGGGLNWYKDASLPHGTFRVE